MATKLSNAQLDVIQRLSASPDQRLVRRQGGFWTTANASVNARGVPEWWAGVSTVTVLARLGVIKRTHEFSETWRDTHILDRERAIEVINAHLERRRGGLTT
jgi:hypothetical protein